MTFAILLLGTLALAASKPMYAAALWAIGIAALHMIEERRGELWAYFGRVSGNSRLVGLSPGRGFLLIVLPAFALQFVAAACAFTSGHLSVFWLALLIGARLGDGLFSHAIPFARGYAPERKGTDAAELMRLNPGLPTGFVYLVDGLLFSTLWGAELTASANRREVILGCAIGAGFFALVLPVLRLLRGRSHGKDQR